LMPTNWRPSRSPLWCVPSSRSCRGIHL
jgi:hypothetical protein